MSTDTPAPPPTSGTAARRARQAAGSGTGTAKAPATDRSTRDRSNGTKRPTARPLGPRREPELLRQLDPDRLVVLEEERDFLLRSLNDLEREHDAGDVDEHDYTALKDDYTVRAAATLRAIDSRQATLDAVRPPRSRRRTWAAVAIVAVIAVGLGIFVAASSGRRSDGDSLSGNIRQTSRDQVLEAQQIYRSDPKKALEMLEAVLQTSPDDVEALTYKGWILFQSSQSVDDQANSQMLAGLGLKSLSEALSIDPNFMDALVFRASIYKALGQPDAARADLQKVTVDQVPEFMVNDVDKLRSEVGLPPMAGTTGTTPGTTP